MNICRSQAQFTSAFLEYYSARESFLQLSGDIGGAIWTPIVDDNYLVIKFTINCQRGHQGGRWMNRLPLCESVIDKGDDDRQILSLIVGWQNDRIFVLGSHCYYG